MAIYIEVIANAEELLEALTRVASGRSEALPCVVLHLEHHSLHVVVEGSEVGILCQSIVAQGLYLILKNGAGLVLEEVGKGCLEGGEVLQQAGIGRELCPTCLDEGFVQLNFLEAPDTVGCAAAPAYDGVAAVAMKADVSAVEDVVCESRRILSSLDGEGRGLGCRGTVLRAETAVLLGDVSLGAEVLYVPAAIGSRNECPVLRKLLGILAFTIEDVCPNALVDVVRLVDVLDAVVLACNRFEEAALRTEVVLHFLHGVVLDESYAPVAA